MKARAAGLSDVGAIHRLIALYASQGLLLPRAEEEIRRNIGHFLVLCEKGKLLSCVALESYGADLAEIRSLAVDPESRARGAGSRLVEFALAEARRRGIARVFAVTHAPEFFLRQGFEMVERRSLAEKIERDCRRCPKRRSCRLAAVTVTVIPDRAILPAHDRPAPAVTIL
jgi:N-acetylglutamate synthase-like GNAT family acetyltransferase